MGLDIEEVVEGVEYCSIVVVCSVRALLAENRLEG